MHTWVKETNQLIEVLNAYRATAEDNSPHLEMAAIADEFAVLAARHKARIDEMDLLNRSKSDVNQNLSLLLKDIDVLETLLGEEGKSPIDYLPVDALTQIVKLSSEHLLDISKNTELRQNETIAAKVKVLTVLNQAGQEWLRDNALVSK